jgi:hypothetical protein
VERAMEHVKKEHYSAFCKHLPICDPSLGVDFLREIQVHYDMNLEPKMLTKKLRMLAYSYVSIEQKLLLQWRLAIWETCFFQKFKPKDGIWRIKIWEQQFKNKKVVKWILYMYSNYTTSFHFQAPTK